MMKCPALEISNVAEIVTQQPCCCEMMVDVVPAPEEEPEGMRIQIASSSKAYVNVNDPCWRNMDGDRMYQKILSTLAAYDVDASIKVQLEMSKSNLESSSSFFHESSRTDLLPVRVPE